MPAYPPEQFTLREDEAAQIQALVKLMKEKVNDLDHAHIWSLRNLERGNATMSAFESWVGINGYGTGIHGELDDLSKRLRAVVNKARNRARRILEKRIRRNPHKQEPKS